MKKILIPALAGTLLIAFLLYNNPNTENENRAHCAAALAPTKIIEKPPITNNIPQNDKRWVIQVDEISFKNICSFIKKTGSYHKASDGYNSYYERSIKAKGYEYTLNLQRRLSSSYLDTVDAVLVETHLLADTSIDGYHDYLIYEGEARSLLFDEHYEKKYFDTMTDSYAVIRTRAVKF